MKSSHTRQPLHTQHTGDKSEKPFFGGNREKNKQSDNAFFQAKKIDGNQDAALENEADAVAQKVTMAQQAPVKSSQRMGQMSVQKKGADDEKDAKAQKKEKKDEKDEPVQKKEEDKKEAPKGAEEEKDAKSTQKKEQKDEKDEAKVQKKGEEDKKDKEGVQKKGDDEEKKDAKPQKKEAKDEKDEGKPQKKEKADEKDDKAASVQKKENKPEGAGEKTEGKHESNEDKFDRLLNKSKDGGSPLPAKVRTQLEHQMNANFEMVRIHTGQEAIEMCNLSKAQAFTHGNDIYFNAAKFDPESTAGMTLLAHELTHVVQQNGPRK